MERKKNVKQWKKLVPMTFYNLNTDTIETYNVNIVEPINYNQRFRYGHIKEIPKQAFEVYADVYDDDGNPIDDDIVFLKYEDCTIFLEALYEIDKLVTPEMLKFRELRDKAMIKYILENNLIEKAYIEVKNEENHT